MTLTTRKIPQSSLPPRATQQGVALVFALVMLLILSMLAASSMATSNLQILMGGGMQEQVRALMRAEDATAAAQNYITTSILPPSSPLPTAAGSGYYIYDSKTKTSGADIDSYTIWSGTGSSVVDSYSRYMVEFIANKNYPDGSIAIGNLSGSADPTRNFYRVTARGTGDRGAQRTLQSFVAIGQAPL